MKIQKTNIRAEEEIDIDTEAADILFETEDVAQLVAEVTGDAVEVSTDDTTGDVTFVVGDDEYTVTPEEDVELVESCSRLNAKRSTQSYARGKRPVKAATNRSAGKSRVIKKFPSNM